MSTTENTLVIPAVSSASYNANTGMMSLVKPTKTGASHTQKRLSRTEFAEAKGLDKTSKAFNAAYSAYCKENHTLAVAMLEKARTQGLVLSSIAERANKDGDLKGMTISFAAAPKEKGAGAAKAAEERAVKAEAEAATMAKELAELRAMMEELTAAKK